MPSTCAQRSLCDDHSRCVVITRSGPSGVVTTASIKARGMFGVASASQGSMELSTCPTGRRDSIMLPKRRRRPFSPGTSTGALWIAV